MISGSARTTAGGSAELAAELKHQARAQGFDPVGVAAVPASERLQLRTAALERWLATVPADRLAQRRDEADRLFRRRGITFAVYGDTRGAERLIPFDVIPRILARSEWDRLSAGCIQRVRSP